MGAAASDMAQAGPQFPPLISGHRADGGADPVDLAFSRAATGELGGGDLVWSPVTHEARFALVVEPDIDAAGTLALVPLMMVAVADALGAIGPPNLALTFDWPATLRANGAKVGSVAMRFPEAVGAGDIPPFAVLGVDLAIAWPGSQRREPGHVSGRTVLHEEGCGDLDHVAIIEACARHFLTWLDTWQTQGFRAVHEHWLLRGPRRGEAVTVDCGGSLLKGEMVGLDEAGGILVRSDGDTVLVSLAQRWNLAGSLGEPG